MSKKPKETEPGTVTAQQHEAEVTAALDQGYQAARRDALRLMLSSADNPGIAFADALYWAGRDVDGVFYLSAEAKALNQPTHVTNKIKDIVRHNRRLSISAISPYRVTRIS